MGSIRDNYLALQERLGRALERCGRGDDRVEIVAVTKNVGVDRIEEAVRAGLTVFGENRVQEAKGKIGRMRGRGIDVSWHMIGHLQRNKARTALSLFSLIHSLDSLPLAAEISKRSEAPADLLLQVNTTGEETKHGVRPRDVEPFLEQVEALPNIRIRGLMTIAPFTDDARRVRAAFRTLRRLFEGAGALPLDRTEMRFLSMGMSGDFEIAIEEGSNMIRVGSALFGPRKTGGGPH